MDRSELYRALTLWFAALILLEVSSGGGAFDTAVGTVAVAVVYLVPAVVVVDVAADLRDR